MACVLQIGAGGVGGVVAHKMAMNRGVFSRIILASRTLGKCKAIADSIRSKNLGEIEIAQVDADSVESLVNLINKYKPNLVLNVALPYQDLSIMEACLRTKTHYLDTANYEHPDSAHFEYKEQWAYDERYKKAGIFALLGSGFDPGVTNVFCAYAQKHYFDEIEEIDILDCNAGDHGYAFATNFNPEINLREVSSKARYWISNESNSSLDRANSACSETNSSLGNHCVDLANFECSQTPSLASHSKFAKNSTSKTANTRILGESQSDSMESNAESSLRDSALAESWQSTNKINPHEVQQTLAPLRGAEKEEKGGSSASALLELEAENSEALPLKAKKQSFLARRGSGEEGAALFAKKSDYINENISAESRRIERAENAESHTESIKESNNSSNSKKSLEDNIQSNLALNKDLQKDTIYRKFEREEKHFKLESNTQDLTNQSYCNGQWRDVAPLALMKEWDYREVGVKNSYLLYHEELESLIRNIKGLRRIRFFMTFGESYLTHMKCLENVGLLRVDKVEHNGMQITPIEVLKTLLPDPASLAPRTKGQTHIGCYIKGRKNGVERTIYIYNICNHEDCYKEVNAQGVSYTTGVPAMIGAKLICEGKWGVGCEKNLAGANSSLGNHCIDLANFEHSQTPSLASRSKFAKNSTSTTANTRILEKTQESQGDSCDSAESHTESLKDSSDSIESNAQSQIYAKERLALNADMPQGGEEQGIDSHSGAGIWNMEQNDPDPFMQELNAQGLPYIVVEIESSGKHKVLEDGRKR